MNDKMFRKAASAALAEWHSDQWDRQRGALDELTQDLWVWYLERPDTQRKLKESDEFLARRLIFQAAMQMLARQALNSDVFDGRAIYSSDSVKAALAGKSTNKYLAEIKPIALKNLEKRNGEQAEAIRSRYEDGVVPEKEGGAAMLLSRAVKSLTEEVNVIYLTTDTDAIGSAASVFPDTRKRKGEHSDPTGNIAVMLIEKPEMREPFYEETPLRQFLGGRGASEEHVLGHDNKQRPIKFRSGR